MAKAKPRRNKAYRPRPVSADGGLHIIGQQHLNAEDARPIAAEDQTTLNLAYWLSFNTMLHGASNEDVWSTVTVSLNIALILAERGFGSEYEHYIKAALDGAFRARVRGDRTGIWRYDGDAINAIRLALEVHDEQVQIATKADIRSAMREVYQRVFEGNVYQHAA